MHVRLFKHSWCSHLLLRWGPNKSLKKCFHTSHVRLKETQITESTILPGKVKNTSDNVSPSLDRSTVLPAGLLDHSYLDIPQKKASKFPVFFDIFFCSDVWFASDQIMMWAYIDNCLFK